MNGAADQRPSEPAVRRRHAGRHANTRPKDAGILIVIRRDADRPRLLMGRRSSRHAFMPNLVVFPGGRVDRADHFGPSADALAPAVLDRLLVQTGARMSARRARAIALAAVRETCEETGIILAKPASAAAPPAVVWKPFSDRKLLPALGGLRLIARAITPPRRSRRFDARFFATFSDQIADQVAIAEDELSEIQWLTFNEARSTDLPMITELILNHLEGRLSTDPDLGTDATIPFHYMRHGRFVCDMI